MSSIDAARGAAMVFVWLSHFSGAYLYPNGRTGTADVLIAVSMIASPSFVLISGMVCGFLAAMHPDSFPRLQRHLLDRGVFLIICGHFVLALSKLPVLPSLSIAYEQSFITDTIGLAIIVGPALLQRTTASHRFLIAAALFAASWVLVRCWLPFPALESTFKLYVVGAPGYGPHAAATQVFPVLPWLAVYLVGTVIGGRVGAHYASGEFRRARALLGGLGAALLLTGLGTYFTARRLAVEGLTWLRSPAVMQLTSPTQKFPPGTTYLLVFGGAGLLVAAMVLHLEGRQWLAWVMQFLRNVGRAALLVFFLQAFMASVLRRLALPYSSAWPLLYLATLLLLGNAAAVWCRIDGNRYFTVGLSALLERRVYRRSRISTSAA